MEGCDAVIHAAAMYEVGIPAKQRPAMWEANVAGTERVMEAALEAKVPQIVYVSTVGVFGNTHKQVVDESYEHPGKEFTSYYEETKLEAHKVAKRMIAEQACPRSSSSRAASTAPATPPRSPTCSSNSSPASCR